MKHAKDKSSKEERRAAELRALSQNMRQLVIGFKATFEDQLREFGLTLPQMRLLKAVEEQADVSSAELARRCHVTPQTLQGMLTRATQAKWIVRGKSARSARFVTATLTPAGEKLVQTGMDAAAKLEATIWGDAGLSDLKRVNELLMVAIEKLGAES